MEISTKDNGTSTSATASENSHSKMVMSTLEISRMEKSTAQVARNSRMARFIVANGKKAEVQVKACINGQTVVSTKVRFTIASHMALVN